jgi:hypothetical protein
MTDLSLTGAATPSIASLSLSEVSLSLTRDGMSIARAERAEIELSRCVTETGDEGTRRGEMVAICGASSFTIEQE